VTAKRSIRACWCDPGVDEVAVEGGGGHDGSTRAPAGDAIRHMIVGTIASSVTTG
jgi:hypothetical protein